MKAYASIKEYIAIAPKDKREVLQKMYTEIKSAAPKATESIKYGMPTFELNGNLVHFAAMKGHLGFYPAPSGVEAYKEKLSAFDTSKGCIRFPYDKKIPYAVVKQIVRFRVKENTSKK